MRKIFVLKGAVIQFRSGLNVNLEFRPFVIVSFWGCPMEFAIRGRLNRVNRKDAGEI